MKKLLNVKKKIGTLSKNSKNPFFKSAYLDLTSLLMELDPLLMEEGLILLQPLDGNKVSTVIMDAEDGSLVIESSMLIPDNITDPQKIGSAITYFRRYTLKSLFAIAEVDDDGNLAAKKSKPYLDDSKLEGCSEWSDEQKEAVKNKFKLNKKQLDLLK